MALILSYPGKFWKVKILKNMNPGVSGFSTYLTKSPTLGCKIFSLDFLVFSDRSAQKFFWSDYYCSEFFSYPPIFRCQHSRNFVKTVFQKKKISNEKNPFFTFSKAGGKVPENTVKLVFPSKKFFIFGTFRGNWVSAPPLSRMAPKPTGKT